MDSALTLLHKLNPEPYLRNLPKWSGFLVETNADPKP